MPRAPASPAASTWRRDLAVAVVFGALYWVTRQAGFYGDGIYYVGLVKAGIGAHAHVFYLPLFRALRALLGTTLELPDRELLQWIAVIPAALCGPLLLRLLALLRPGARGAFWLLPLVLLAPAFWSFAGATENHAINACCTLWTLCCAARYGVWHPRTAVAWMTACGTHLTGVLFGPSLLLLDARRHAQAGTRTVTGFVLAGATYLALFAATFAIGLWIDPEPVKNYLFMLSQYRPDGVRLGAMEYLWTEGPARMGLLLVLAPVGVLRQARREPRLTLALTLPLLFYVVATLRVRAVEHGAYFVPLYPVLGALSLLAVHDLKPDWLQAGAQRLLAALALGQVLLGLQGRALAMDPEEAVARELAPLLRPGDRVFFDLRDWRPMVYAEYYLGPAFDSLLTNLAALDPTTDFGAEIRKRYQEEPEAALIHSIAAAHVAGGRALLSTVLMADPARAPQPFQFLATAGDRWRAREVMAAGGRFLELTSR